MRIIFSFLSLLLILLCSCTWLDRTGPHLTAAIHKAFSVASTTAFAAATAASPIDASYFSLPRSLCVRHHGRQYNTICLLRLTTYHNDVIMTMSLTSDTTWSCYTISLVYCCCFGLGWLPVAVSVLLTLAVFDASAKKAVVHSWSNQQRPG